MSDDFYVAALDFPGSGFSDKPLNDFSYMLAENAQILDYFVTDIVQFDDFACWAAFKVMGLPTSSSLAASSRPGSAMSRQSSRPSSAASQAAARLGF